MDMPTRVSEVTQNRHLGQVVVIALSSLSRALTKHIGSDAHEMRPFPSEIIARAM